MSDKPDFKLTVMGLPTVLQNPQRSALDAVMLKAIEKHVHSALSTSLDDMMVSVAPSAPTITVNESDTNASDILKKLTEWRTAIETQRDYEFTLNEELVAAIREQTGVDVSNWSFNTVDISPVNINRGDHQFEIKFS